MLKDVPNQPTYKLTVLERQVSKLAGGARRKRSKNTLSSADIYLVNRFKEKQMQKPGEATEPQ